MRDNYDAFLEHEGRVRHWLERRPKCDRCGEHIQDEYMYKFDGEQYCPECFKEFIDDNFRHPVED